MVARSPSAQEHSHLWWEERAAFLQLREQNENKNRNLFLDALASLVPDMSVTDRQFFKIADYEIFRLRLI